MESLSNNNNDSEAALTSNSKTIQNLSTASAHPLEDISLTDHENIPEIQQQQQQQPQLESKKNWVKFDDDVNEHNANNNNNKSQNNYDQTDSTARATPPSLLSTSPTAPTALLPPPQATSRSRTLIEREKSQTQLQRESVTSSPLSASPTPAQRSIVASTTANTTTATNAAPDVAPAVLTTESTHVNLNASGKVQQQQQLKSKAGSNSNSSNQQHQIHHQANHPQQLQAHHTQLPTNKQHQQINSSSSNNGTTVSSTTATKTGVPTPLSSSSNNAMHHKSHQKQHQQHQHQQHQNSSAATTTSPVEASTSMTSMAAGPPAMRTIELSTGRIREGFANGDVIVTLLPANTKWPWITPAIFRPELVPEELMAQGLTLTVEDYVQAMETLVNDYRFTMYNICYKRILVCWIVFAFTVLLALLFSGLQGVALFSLGVGWLFLNAAAIFICMWVKLRLARGLEKCLARVNRQLMKHKILLVLDDRGRISCHKVNLCFMYFDSTQCVNFLNEFLEQTEQNGGEQIKAGWESKLDIDLNDIVIQGSTPVRVSRKQAVAQELYLSYLQRWGKDFLRRRLDWTVQEAGVHEMPRHLQSSICPCQYEEEILRNKIKMHLRRRQCCGIDCLGCWL